MGLDMYLRGEKFFWSNWTNQELDRKEDGFKVRDLTLELGYWRKHPDLHGYIVQTFAGGVDECQKIELTGENLRTIIGAIRTKKLPRTDGFFFGASENGDEQIKDDVAIFVAAIEWLEEGGIAPASLSEPVEIGLGMTMYEVKPDTTRAVMKTLGAEPKQENITRTVHYRASW